MLFKNKEIKKQLKGCQLNKSITLVFLSTNKLFSFYKYIFNNSLNS